MSTTTGTKTTIETLNSLLRGELAAIATYEMAVRAIDGAAASDARQLLQLASEHKRSAETLKATISALGAAPDEAAGVWGTVTRLVQGSADLFGDRAAVKSLLEGEELGLGEYEKAIEAVQPEIRRVIQQELVPRQRKHIAALSEIQLAMRSSS
jgi:bacterioferritin (cytochrome b1)